MLNRTYDFGAREALYRSMPPSSLVAALTDAHEARKVATANARAAEGGPYSCEHLNHEEGYYQDDVSTIVKVLNEKLDRKGAA